MSTTAAILTPPGRGAVTVIAVDGPQAAQLVQEFLHARGEPSFAKRPLGRILYGRWGGEPAEDVIACRRTASQVEIHCHGGAAAADRILADLISAGAKVQSWTEWIDRHETSPLRAAARAALAHATTHRTASILLDQYHGALETSLRQIIAQLDAANPTAAAAHLSQLLARAPTGLHLTQPWRVVIAGPPNVGKSSLLNALLGYRRAIVFDQPGTTRDVVAAATAIDGWPVELSDTAGLRASDDPLESAGATRAAQQAQAADCLLLVFDISQPWTPAHNHLAEKFPHATLVGNKRDLITSRSSTNPPPATLFTSALSADGIDDLLENIASRLVPTKPQPGDAIPFMPSQVAKLNQALDSLANAAQAKSILLSLLAKG